jgi:hypothetical protein
MDGPEYHLLNTIIKGLPITSADKVAAALITIYTAIHNPLSLLKHVISQEVETTSMCLCFGLSNTLFRKCIYTLQRQQFGNKDSRYLCY